MSAPEKFAYPEDFIERVRETFPDNTGLHKLLEEGDPSVSEYLADRTHDLAPAWVLDGLDGGLDGMIRLREEVRPLARIAQLHKRCTNLYEKWLESQPGS